MVRAPRLSQSSPIPQPAPKNLAKIDPEPRTSEKATPTTTSSTTNRHNENVRGYFLRPADLPWKGTISHFLRVRQRRDFPPRGDKYRQEEDRSSGTITARLRKFGVGKCRRIVAEELCRTKISREHDLTKSLKCRVSCTSVATARSSGSKTANPSPSSCSARTLVASPGPFCTAGNTARVSLRYDLSAPTRVQHPILEGGG